MVKHITELRDIHKGEDIYILASGASIDYIPEGFYDNKIIMGVNQAFKKVECDYIVRKEIKMLKESLDSGAVVIVSQYDSGNLNSGVEKLNTNKIEHNNLFYFEHLDNEHNKIDTSVLGTDKIVVSFSTITSAMHIAAYMGAVNIILMGHDCGTINGKLTFDGYYNSIKETPWQNWEQYKNWLKVIESQSVKLKYDLKKVYNCNIVSINPFVSLNLENNIFN